MDSKTIIEAGLAAIAGGEQRPGRVPKFWDGRAAERIVDVLVNRSVAHAGAKPRESPPLAA
jgi:hypothetical protein